jgi:hypothetical protein
LKGWEMVTARWGWKWLLGKQGGRCRRSKIIHLATTTFPHPPPPSHHHHHHLPPTPTSHTQPFQRSQTARKTHRLTN